MALIKSVRGPTPKVDKDTLLTGNTTIMGGVEIDEGCGIWFGAVLHGDMNSVRIGNGTNIQDGSVPRTLYEKSTIKIGDDAPIDHNVTTHETRIYNGALVGMGSAVLDRAIIGGGTIIAAGSIVLDKVIAKPGNIYAEVPAKLVKKVDPERAKEIDQKITENYYMYSSWYKE